MHRKLAVLILYSALLLLSGFIFGRSTATTAAPIGVQDAQAAPPTAPADDQLTSSTELTDWPDLTP